MASEYTAKWMDRLITQINTDNNVGGGTPGSISVSKGVGGYTINQMTSEHGSQTHVVDAVMSKRETCLVLEGMLAMKIVEERGANKGRRAPNDYDPAAGTVSWPIQ